MIWTAKGNKKANIKAGDNPLYERTNNQARDMFIDKCVKKLGCTVKDIKTKNKIVPIEKMLVYKNRSLCHCASRSGHLFTVGIRTIDKGNEIRKLFNNDDVDKAFDDLKEICKKLDETKTTPKKSTARKNSSVIELLEAKEKKARSYQDSNGFSLGSIKITPEVEKWVEGKGYKLQSKSVKW